MDYVVKIVILVHIIKTVMIKLSESKIFTEYHILSIDASFDKTRHMRDLGLIEGSKIKILSNNNGNIIFYIHNTRLALTKNLSKNIMVE